MNKTCARCREVKLLSEFTLYKTGKSDYYCKKCRVLISRESLARHPEKRNLRDRRRRFQKIFGDAATSDDWRAPSRNKDGLIIVTDEGRICPKCKERKPLSEFPGQRMRGYCKPCHNAQWHSFRKKNPEKEYKRGREKHLIKKYGLTIEAFDLMLAKQDGRCACCKSPDPKTKNGWQVDHDHRTGKVRAILCRPCNQTLGYCEENVARLHMIVAYIKRHRPKERNEATYLPGLSTSLQ